MYLQMLLQICYFVTPVTTLTTLCLLYTSDAADDLLCVDLGGRRIIKKKAEPTKHKPGGHIERIQKDFWFGLSLRGPLAS